MHPLSEKYNFLYLISELFRSVRKTCSCTHSGQLILKKISKIGATRYQILSLKCTKFDFRWGATSDTAGRAYSAPPEPLATSKGRKGKGGKGKGKREEREWEGKEGGQNDLMHPLLQSPSYATVTLTHF